MEKDVSEAKAKFLGVVNITPEGWSQLEKNNEPTYRVQVEQYNQAIRDSKKTVNPELVERIKNLAQKVGVQSVQVLPSPNLLVKTASDTIYIKESDPCFPKDSNHLDWVLVRHLIAMKL